MVNIALPIDGQTASQSQVDGQGQEDPDEPPLRSYSHSIKSNSKHEEHVVDLTTGDISRAETIVENDGNGTWNGEVGHSHRYSPSDILAVLGVDPRYALLSFHEL